MFYTGGCGIMVSNINNGEKRHLTTECANQHVNCMYAAAGCVQTPMRCELLAHEADSRYHLDLLMV